MLEFAYVCFVNNHNLYLGLLQSTIQSVIEFSKHTIIVYAIDIPEDICKSVFPDHPRVQIRRISKVPEVSCIFYYKPWIIKNAIESGVKSGYYIECDDVITPAADDYLQTVVSRCTEYPISPIHPHDPKIAPEFMNNLGVHEKTQPYAHGHVLFNSSCLNFITEWYNACLKSYGECWDESVLNCMYWKHGLKDHYMPIIDPYYTEFYTNSGEFNPIVSYHGCKNPQEQYKLFVDLAARSKSF
jgi:hypothetical protein